MNAEELIFYGLGEVIYSIAKADGKVQEEEIKAMKEIVDDHLERHEFNIDYSSIIFEILRRDNILTSKDCYSDGMKNINLGGNHFTPELKEDFLKIVEKIAESFPPNTNEEQDIITRFTIDLEKVK